MIALFESLWNKRRPNQVEISIGEFGSRLEIALQDFERHKYGITLQRFS